MKTLLSCVTFGALFSQLSWGADLENQPNLTLDGAKRIAAAAVAYAHSHHAPGAAVAVVDAGGHTIYLESLDGTFAAGSDISIGKARTAVVFKRATHDIEDTINKGRTAMVPVVGVTWFTPLQGGIPIIAAGHIVGGIGCSGAASAQQDEEVAMAGAAAAKDFVSAGEPAASAASQSEVTHVSAAIVEKSFAQGMTGGVVATGPGFSVNPSRREGPGEVEVHANDSDIIYVLQGAATIVTGGRIIGAHEVSPGEMRGTSIEDGVANQVVKGDVLTIPSGTPHWFKSVRAPFRYYTVKSSLRAAADPGHTS